ncbi:MAG TPA: AAA family ATPase [Pseudonocardiaceae bacterium]|nr:AAA family ATPase [Pseudonocardiaceae bacterium]
MLFGRAAALESLLRAAGSATEPPLTLVAGPSGIGRSALLDELSRAVAQRGGRVCRIRFTLSDHSIPFAGLVRLAGEALALADAARPADEPGLTEATHRRRSLAGLIAGAAHLPASAERAAAVLAGMLAEAGPLVLVVDDLQWLDRQSLVLTEPLVRALAGTGVTCVGAIDGQPVAEPDVLAKLRVDGLARVLALRPLNRAESAALIADTLQATPQSALVAALTRAARGRPGALLAALAGHRGTAAIRIADRHAYLLRPHQPPALPEEHPLFAPIARLGDQAWAVAKALAVLRPLTGPVLDLVAEALEIDDPGPALDRLRTAGVLGPNTGAAGLRFRVPLLADALLGCLRPFERRRLAQVAVTALWSGRATCADPNYRADRLADAGRLVDPDRAREELLERAGALMLESGGRAEGWLQAAAGLTVDPVRRAHILYLHAATSCIHGDYRSCMASSTVLLAEHAGRFDEDALQELDLIHVTSLRGLGDTAGLNRLVEVGEHTPARRVVTTAAALSLLDRWREAADLLESAVDHKAAGPASADLAEIFRAGAAFWLGRPERFERNLSDPTRWRLNGVGRHHLERVQSQARLLLAQGELHRAEELLAAERVPAQRMSTTDRSLLAGATGDWRAALNLARLSIATGNAPGYEPGHVAMHQLAATILLASGQPNRARALLDAALAADPVLPHLLAGPAAAVERAFGFPDRAARRLRDGLELAADKGFVMGTDLLWFELAELELLAVRPERARVHLTELDRVADAVGGTRPALHSMIIRAVLEQDADTAERAIRLAARRGQPFEQARTIDVLVRHGVGAAEHLLTAYRLLGRLGALLHRTWLRTLMREHDVAVPGRRAATAENERLLAELVTEGLSNRQLAVVLGTSERSVEGRLSRLFSRTGYRSRVELATAMLTSDYPDDLAESPAS